jgi:uncharacterized membrane protein YeaQ/YmgE (transglycosylase-associated protein family)
MIGALVLGVVAGFLARAVVRNDAFEGLRGPKSWLVSIVLGLVGAVVGYFIFNRGLGIGDDDVFDLGGIIGAIIGAVLVLLFAGWAMRRSDTGRRRTRGA